MAYKYHIISYSAEPWTKMNVPMQNLLKFSNFRRITEFLKHMIFSTWEMEDHSVHVWTLSNAVRSFCPFHFACFIRWTPHSRYQQGYHSAEGFIWTHTDTFRSLELLDIYIGIKLTTCQIFLFVSFYCKGSWDNSYIHCRKQSSKRWSLPLSI